MGLAYDFKHKIHVRLFYGTTFISWSLIVVHVFNISF